MDQNETNKKSIKNIIDLLSQIPLRIINQRKIRRESREFAELQKDKFNTA